MVDNVTDPKQADLIAAFSRGFDDPIVATAIHDGHALRTGLADLFAVSEPDRLREEDPFTSHWARVASTHIVGLRSRFEVDLNRPREKAVYLVPADAWGIEVWKDRPPDAVVAQSLSEYDAFYREVGSLLREVEQKFGRFVVLDLHSYNHRREGPTGPVADPFENPEVNVGTGTMHQRWRSVCDGFIDRLRAFDFLGGHLDVRENVKFRGGHFSQWIHQNFPDSGCVLAVEFKKFFMDEWTGEPDPAKVDAIEQALKSTIPGLVQGL